MRRWRWATALGLVIAAAPGVAHADAAGPSDWQSEIVSIVPASNDVSVTIEGGDAFVRLAVEPGHEALVLGYSGEPYLRFDDDGGVYENRQSYATYYNASRDGTGAIPDGLDADAEPDWSRIGDGGAWAWHDHRAHYMGGTVPPDLQPGGTLAPQVIPITVDGVPTEVTVQTRLMPDPSWWPSVLGALAGAGLVSIAFAARRRAAVDAAMIVLGAAALGIGLAQYRSLPPETGPSVTWWLMPAITVVCGLVSIALGRRSPFVRHGLALIGIVQLLIWGWTRRAGLTRGMLPTAAPFALDRAVTAAALAGGVALLVVEGLSIAGTLRAGQRPIASSMAASSSA